MVAMASQTMTNGVGSFAGTPMFTNSGSVSPHNTSIASSPKVVSFELLFPETPQYRARLPLRVSIFPHDTTDSIVTTVKNFYGLYSGPTVSKGVSFEDEHSNTLIARYENFRNNMVVYVRVIEEAYPINAGAGAAGFHNSDAVPLQMARQTVQHISRPTSRASRKRSPSPNPVLGQRSASTASKRGRSRPSKTRGSGSQLNGDVHGDSFNGYSSGDGTTGSASGKSKEQIGTTEISLENIVEGGRRKRPKFESSELPLFAPPQMPAVTSNPSVSPARRADSHRQSLTFVHPGQNPFTNPRPLQSPQSYGIGFGSGVALMTPTSDLRRHRGSIGFPSNGVGPGLGTMPTPDPTVGSCMSEEDKDVAMQLMRLGDIAHVSHGRTSASTLDETFSGRADAASSTGATSDAGSDSGEEVEPSRKQKLDTLGNQKRIFQTKESHFAAPRESVEASCDDADYIDGVDDGVASGSKPKMLKSKIGSSVGGKSRPQTSAKAKFSKAGKAKVKKATAHAPGPMSPASLPASRKPSLASNGLGPMAPGEDDEPDLSTKPRCQRCRKSKKGCDRQRPCGRCRDAGLTAEECISEDEGNGRKGRYGRHMGVPISKEAAVALSASLPAVSTTPGAMAAPALPITTAATLYKNKKRKR